MKADTMENKQGSHSEDPEDLSIECPPDQESVGDDLTANTSEGDQGDDGPEDLTGSKSESMHVDESLYDDLFEISAANSEVDNIDNLYDDLMGSDEDKGPELFSEPILICVKGKEFEATLAEPFSPSGSTVFLLADPDRPQTEYAVSELDYLGLSSLTGELAGLDTKTIPEVMETTDGQTIKVDVPVGQSFDAGVFCSLRSKANRFRYFFYLNRYIKSRYRTSRIGEILLESALVSKQLLEEALVKQKNMRNFRIGQILAKLAKLPPKKVEQVLDTAWRNHAGPNRIFAGDILVKAGLVTRQQVEKAEGIQEKLRKKKIGEVLLESGSVSEEKLYGALAEKFRKPFIDLKSIEPSDDAKALLPRDIVLELMVMPLSIESGRLILATSRPEITEITSALNDQLNCPFDIAVATPSELKAAIIKKYGN